jgi:transcriptional regulator with XRE-family HTH domain
MRDLLHISGNSLSIHILRVDAASGRLKNAAVNKEQLAEKIRTGRARLKLNRVQFANLADITTNTLRALEEGTHSQVPDTKTLEKVAKALGVTMKALLIGGEAIAPDNPLLKDLSDEDLEIAQAHHHAINAVRQRIALILENRQPPAVAPSEDLKQRAADVALRVAGYGKEAVEQLESLAQFLRPRDAQRAKDK